MKLKIRKRAYRMKDADLVQLSDDLVDSAERDATELATYGITAATLTSIGTAREAFAAMPSDVAYMGDMMIATENKNATRTEALIAVRQIAGRAKLLYGENSAKYRKFGTEDLSQQTDNDLVRVIRGVVLTATEYLAELADKGLTQEMIDDLDALRILFDDQIDVQKNKIKTRDLAVDERIRLGNELYAQLVVLADSGKLCWESVNEAKYNDYVINKTSSTAQPPFEVDGTVPANSVVSTSVSGVSPTTQFVLKNTGDVVLEYFFAANPTDTSGTNVFTVLPNSEANASATDLGFNEAEDITRLNVYNSNPEAGSYLIEWE